MHSQVRTESVQVLQQLSGRVVRKCGVDRAERDSYCHWPCGSYPSKSTTPLLRLAHSRQSARREGLRIPLRAPLIMSEEHVATNRSPAVLAGPHNQSVLTKRFQSTRRMLARRRRKIH
jgi:hypothetical protein